MSVSKRGFSADGMRYIVRDVRFPGAADSDLWNDRMCLMMDHRGTVRQAGFLEPNMTQYSEPLRAFYIRDDASGRFWSAPHEPVQGNPSRFEFSAGMADFSWVVVRDGMEVRLMCVVPREDALELWKATVRNVSGRARRISLYSYFPCGLLALLAQHSWYRPGLGAMHSYFPYYVKHQDYHVLSKLTNGVMCASDRAPDGWELSIGTFSGGRGLHDPAALHDSALPSRTALYEVANERSASIFQFRMNLRPGREESFQFVFGPARDEREMRKFRKKYLRPGSVERERDKAQKFLDRFVPAVTINTPDAEFNAFVNRWLPRRAVMLARTIRFNLAPQGRNVIQDAMGGSYVDSGSSRDWFSRIWAHQHTNGWLPHGMPFAPGVKQIEINSIPHKDINSWGPGAVACYMYETGDESILDIPIAFADKPAVRAPLYEHVCLGLDWLLADRTKRGLCRIGQGDWNDPLNQAGMREKGESLWLTEALVVALQAWAEVARWRGDVARARGYVSEALRTVAAIRKYGWDGKWMRRGYTDEGRPFGTRTDREGKIFVNSQSWGMMAGVMSPLQVKSTIRSVERMLMSDSGPMTLAPAFTKMRHDIGKLTQKIPGWNENGSVYCHAAVFYAYALYCVREREKAFRVVRTLLPGGYRNTVARTGQAPLYIPNFYRGTGAGRNAGKSSHSPNTGTVSWYYRTVIEQLLGLRAERNVLVVDPQLPRQWKNISVRRRWRGADFDIRIKNTGRAGRCIVVLDGEPLDGCRVPVQKAGTKHQVDVTV